MGTVKQYRGFAAMDPVKRREISRKGGRRAQELGTGHRFTSDEAKRAGAKGGFTVSRDRGFMSRIGRIGGLNAAITKPARREARAAA